MDSEVGDSVVISTLRYGWFLLKMWLCYNTVIQHRKGTIKMKQKNMFLNIYSKHKPHVVTL